MVRDLLAEVSSNPFASNYSSDNPFASNNDTISDSNPFASDQKKIEVSDSNPFSSNANTNSSPANPVASNTQTASASNPFGANYTDVENPPQQKEDDNMKSVVASFDRKLWESSSEEEDSAEYEPEVALDFTESNAKFEALDADIDELEQITKEIRKKCQMYDQTSDNSELQSQHQQIHVLIDEGRRIAQRVAVMMKNQRKDLYDTFGGTSGGEQSTLVQWQKNRFQLCTTRYDKAFTAYRHEVDEFREGKEKRIKRLAGQIDLDLTEDQIDSLVDDPAKAQAMMQEQLASTELLENLVHLEETRDKMKVLEEGVAEILQMWKDFNQVLVNQQDQINSIEMNIVKAHTKVKTGVKHLKSAQGYQKCAYRNQCIMLFCCVVILLCVVLPMLN